MTEDEFEKKYNKMEKDNGKYTNGSSPETRERLKALETTNIYMVQEMNEIKTLVKGLDKKLDAVVANKADKEEVKHLQRTVDDLEIWKVRIMVVGSIVLFLVTFFKEIIINALK